MCHSLLLKADLYCPSLCRILLVGVAILSLYSVHLLLMTAKEGGWYLSLTQNFYSKRVDSYLVVWSPIRDCMMNLGGHNQIT